MTRAAASLPPAAPLRPWSVGRHRRVGYDARRGETPPARAEEPTMADSDDTRLAALLQLRLRWAPDPAASGLYLPESAALGIRLRPDEATTGPRYALLLDGVAVRMLDILPAGWAVDHGRDLVAEALDRLGDGASEVRRRAIWQLQALGDRRALPALERTALADQGQVSVE